MIAALKTTALLAFIAFACLPLVQMTMVSFIATLPTPDAEVGSVTFGNYRRLLADPALRAAFGNSIAYVVLNICITVPRGYPRRLRLCAHVVCGRPASVSGLHRVSHHAARSADAADLSALLGVGHRERAFRHCAGALSFHPARLYLDLQGFIAAVPKELDETAFLDGYSRPRFIWTHLLPLIAPGIAVTAFFCFMFSWVEVVFARILTTTGGKPISMAINALFGFRTDVGLVMAVTVASILPGAVLLFFMRNHLSRGFRVGKV